MASGRYQPAAGIMALLANINRDPKKTPPFTPDEFNPFAQRREAEEVLPGSITDLKVFLQK